MTDDFEESLRETLANAVPTPPEERGRAAGARAYSRRVRTRAALAIGAVAVVVGAIVVIPNVVASSDDSAHPSVNTPANRKPLPMPSLAHPFTCASGAGPHSEAAVQNGVIPSGAVLARICPLSNRSAHWAAPVEPLVTDVERLVSDVNALPRSSTVDCSAGAMVSNGVTFRLTFQYPDGHTVSALGSTEGCKEVTTGAVRRAGVDSLLRGYLNLLHDQRATYAPAPDQPGPLECSGGRPRIDPVIMSGRGAELTSAIACSYAGPSLTGRGRLSAPLLSQLNDDLAAQAGPWGPPPPCGQPSTLVLRGVNAGGDPVELVDRCSMFTFTDSGGTWYWTPSQQILSMLESALHPTYPPRGIIGRLLGVGGPAGGVTPFTWAGRITLRSAAGVYHASAGDDGRFGVSVPPGRYRVTGHSPSYAGGLATCNPVHPFVTVHAHQLTRVNVFCQMR